MIYAASREEKRSMNRARRGAVPVLWWCRKAVGGYAEQAGLSAPPKQAAKKGLHPVDTGRILGPDARLEGVEEQCFVASFAVLPPMKRNERASPPGWTFDSARRC